MVTQRNQSILYAILAVIVVAAIVAFAVPMWRTHQIRSHVANALAAADGAKLAVLEAETIAGSLDKVKAADVGYRQPPGISPYVAQIGVTDGGIITVATRDTGAAPDPVLTLTPNTASTGADAQLRWQCRLVAGKAAVAPEGCTAETAAGMASASTAMATSTMSPAVTATTR